MQVVNGPTGRVEVKAPTDETLQKALELITATLATPEAGKTYM